MPSVDLFIPAAPKDYVKLPFVLDSVDRYLPDITAAHIVTRKAIPPIIEIPTNGFRFSVQYHTDREVLDFDPQRFKFRPTWVYQQFLKLFQQVTSDWYLVMDADRFINGPQDLFDGEHPIMFLRDRDENHAPYFEYNRAMLGIGKVYPHTFLSECTLYSRSQVEIMLLESGLTADQWLMKSAEIITRDCCIADAELYGSFVFSRQPDLYRFKVLRDYMQGKYANQGEWTSPQIAAYVEAMRGRDDLDFFTAHSWHD